MYSAIELPKIWVVLEAIKFILYNYEYSISPEVFHHNFTHAPFFAPLLLFWSKILKRTHKSSIVFNNYIRTPAELSDTRHIASKEDAPNRCVSLS